MLTNKRSKEIAVVVCEALELGTDVPNPMSVLRRGFALNPGRNTANMTLGQGSGPLDIALQGLVRDNFLTQEEADDFFQDLHLVIRLSTNYVVSGREA